MHTPTLLSLEFENIALLAVTEAQERLWAVLLFRSLVSAVQWRGLSMPGLEVNDLRR